jgi:Fe-S-cluster-containing hydrogenase component 2
MEAIKLVDDIAFINKDKCIGCGVCSAHCPASAIKLDRTGMRNVFVPPVRRKERSLIP